MLRYLYPCKLLRRTSSDCLKNGVTIYNNQSINHVKYMCYEEKESPSRPPDNVREIPLRVESNLRGGEFPQQKQTSKERSTVSAEEIDKFQSMANSWWDVEGDLKPLHSLNKLRVALVRDGLIQTGVCNPDFVNGPEPLKGLTLLDVGCGGGILCEPLARLGAEVTGLDPAEQTVAAAELHAQKDKRITANVRYVQGTVEEHAEEMASPYDAVIASEVLEHVASTELFVEACVNIIKPGGSFFITTINRTTRSWLGAIIVAEYVLGLLPRGTHDWNKFIPPQQLMCSLEKNGCWTSLLHGMVYIPFRNEWFWSPDSSVSYALHALKHHEL